MKKKEIKNRLEGKSGYGKDITENRIIYDSEENKFDSEASEDVTAYGEFISSYFAWIPLSKQKRRAEELNEMTKSKKDVNK